MTDNRLSQPVRTATFIQKNGSWLLIIPSVIVGALVVELLSHLFLPPNSFQSRDMRSHGIIFFDGRDTIFRNQGDIFTYVPHGEMRNVTGFFSDDDFKIEYDYRFRTNNLGLVQDSDIVPERESLLFLGDSFTEGQGAEPWFRLVSPAVDKLGLQGINGGLMATGFVQWLKLDRYLAASNMRIHKVVVLFISFDYVRSVLNFKENDFRCLVSLSDCRVKDTLFYRLPAPGELPSWIAKIRAEREATSQQSWLGARVEALLPASYHVYQYLSNVSERFQRAANILRSVGSEQETRAAIAELIKIHGAENVAFIHLPQKDEVETGSPIALGVKARRSIEEAGGTLFDGFKLCGLAPADYYPNDEHPTSGGYAKIASCVTKILNEWVPGAQRQ